MKTMWLSMVLVTILLTGLACGVQPETGETVEAQAATVAAASSRLEANAAPIAPALQDPVGETLLRWQGPALFAEDQTECHQLIVTADDEAFIGLCSEAATPVPLLATHEQVWGDIVARFAPFEAEIGDRQVVFRGRGDIGGPAWERAVAAWASLTQAELAGGRVSATGPTVLAWDVGRLPDQPDVCRKLIALIYGYAMAGTTPCEGGGAEDFAGDWIDVAAWEQFDAWLYGNAPVYTDTGYLDGRGSAEMSQADLAALADWAQAVYEDISQTAAGFEENEGGASVEPPDDAVGAEAEDIAPAKPARLARPALFVVAGENGKYGYVDQAGQAVVEPQYDYAGSFIEGRAMIHQDNEWGFLDETGREIVPPQYESVNPFAEGLAAVLIDGRWGVIDRSGRVVIEPAFAAPLIFRDGLAHVSTLGQWGLIDAAGQYVVEPQYDWIDDFYQNRALAQRGGQFGYLDSNGRPVIEPQVDEAGRFPRAGDPQAGLAPVRRDELFGYLDAAGQIVIELQFAFAGPFSEGLAVALKSYDDLRYGYIDSTGQYAIAPQFDGYNTLFFGQPAFPEGLAAVSLAGQWGFIDPTGAFVIELQFTFAENFAGGVARVALPNQYGLIDTGGAFIWGPVDRPSGAPLGGPGW